jgi:Tfp pilus assembly protein PilF
LYRSVDAAEGEADALGDLGLIYQDLGDLTRAGQCHHQALGITRQIADLQGEANQLGNLGLIAYERRAYDEARGYHEQALQIDRAIGYRLGQALDLANLGNTERALGDLEGAIKRFREALSLFREIGFERGAMRQLASIGLARIDGGQAEQALSPLHEALALAETEADLDAQRQILTGLGDASALMGSRGEARRHYQAAIDALEFLRGSVTQHQQRVGFLGSDRLSPYTRMVALELSEGNEVRALEYAERSRSRLLLEQLGTSPLSPPATVARDLVVAEEEYLARLRDVVASQFLAQGDLPRSVRQEMRALQRDLHDLWSRIRPTAPDYVALRRGEAAAYLVLQQLLNLDEMSEHFG